MTQQSDVSANEYGLHVVVRLRTEWVDQQPDEYNLAARVETLIAGLQASTPVPRGSEPRDREVWRRISTLAPSLKFEQVLSQPSHERLRGRLQKIGRPFRLRYFLTAACPTGIKPPELALLLKQLSFVADAYEDAKAVLPSVGSCPSTILSPPQDAKFSQQGYLFAGPTGIDALFLREHWPGGMASRPGLGVHIADLEQGWNIAHEDLPMGIPVHGTNVVTSWNHGTAVLGIVVAQPNVLGCLGIAPGTQMIAVSHEGRSKLDALEEAIDLLSAGDILLVEVAVRQRMIYNPSPSGGGPEERDDIPLPLEAGTLEKIAIEDAIALDITVVEAAGNGTTDLDTVFDLSNNRVFSAATDSGAIIVAGATSTVPHLRAPGSNIGSSISCYAWGQHVTTCWHDANDPTKLYTDKFGVSSAAAAIIAGAAAAVQSFAVVKTGAALNPAALRQLLQTGGTTSADKIGVMPDLKQIVTSLCAGSNPSAPTNLRTIN